MSVTKSFGNMYPWVTHMWSPLQGECSHRCTYCYAKTGRAAHLHTGPLRLSEAAMKDNLGKGRTIFVEHRGDLFAADVHINLILQVLQKCCTFPCNRYVFQTKNPVRFAEMLAIESPAFPRRIVESCFGQVHAPVGGSIFGVTIETNDRRLTDIHSPGAPPPSQRAMVMSQLREKYGPAIQLFVTIEPVLDFDPEILGGWISHIRPDFLNLGADSKGHNLPEPTMNKIERLVAILKREGIELREKYNLQRLRSA